MEHLKKRKSEQTQIVVGRGPRLRIHDWEAIRVGAIIPNMGGLMMEIFGRQEGDVSVAFRWVIFLGIILEDRF